MSTIQQLLADLNILQSESRRKNVEIKQACEKAQSSLKVYAPSGKINEIDRRETKTSILKPFLLACRTGNAKLAVVSVSSIHKLIMSGCIEKDSLPELLDALTEGTHLAMDIQLRILQCLPTLMQKYGSCFSGNLVTKVLTLCASMTSNNKSTVVINTASATLQQLFSSVFDRTKVDEYSEEKKHEVKLEDDSSVIIDDLSLENYNIFKDLCNIIEKNETEFFSKSLKIKTLSVLEIVESVIANHKTLFETHAELMHLVRVRVIPSLLRILNNPVRNFPYTARAMRNIQVLIASQLKNLVVESEMVISFLNHILLSDEGNQDDEGLYWETILALEVFLGFFGDFEIIKSIFLTYDDNPKKKNVIKEILSIINTYISHNSFLITETIESLEPTSDDNNAQNQGKNLYLSKATSGMKIYVLDHLEKTEPPHSIPKMYPIYLASKILIAYADGIANFVGRISNREDPSTLESDVEFINNFIESNYTEIYSLFQKFLYTRMDNETFHLLIRSLQKYIHTSGLLGLTESRDGLLRMLSSTVVVPVNKSDITENISQSSSLQEQGKNLLALGESLVETISSTLQNTNDMSNVSGTHRAIIFNSRKATCLRALVNLAISLGSTLQDSWKIIWITLQWCDYYMNGPDEFSGPANRKTNASQDGSSQPTAEKNNLETLERRLMESIKGYPKESFQQLMTSLVDLLDSSLDPEKKQTTDVLRICPFNTTFFLTKIQKVCEINLDKFFSEGDEIWDFVCSYFIKVGSKRSLNYNLRIYVTSVFNSIVRDLAKTGFMIEDPRVNKMTSAKSLEALIGFLNSIFELGPPKELLVLNCETEIQLLISTNLHELIDNYDSYYKHSWHLVFEILSTPFKNKSPEKQEDNILKEKKRLLIESSFDTLRLILDEFLSSLPSGQLKLLIDTLYNFCAQKYDLNISFSAVSYFWLIGDTLKVHISEVKSTELDTTNIPMGEDELINYLESKQDDSQMFYILLDVYLLSSLVKCSTDFRARVRDGSIQTFFQIIDVHGNLLLPIWNNIYETVILNFLQIQPDLNATDQEIKEWLDSIDLILAGLVSLYSKFLMDFEVDHFKEWQGLITCFNNLTQHKLTELNVKVYKSYRDLLVPFERVESKSGEDFDKIKNLLFDFWINVPIDYVFLDSKYQESLVDLMECFPPLYAVIRDGLKLDQATSIINSLNRCARYPVLPDNTKDDTRPSKLQNIVLNNFKIIETKDSSIQSQLIQQLSSMAVYPFGIRQRIEQKLSSNLNTKLNLSSFIALSHISVGILQSKFEQLSDLSVLIEDRGVVKLLRSLLELVSSKTKGIKNGKQNLWKEANDFLLQVIFKLILENKSHPLNVEIWTMILAAVKACFVSQGEDEERENLQQYSKLIEPVLPALLENARDNNKLIEDFTQQLYTNSFLYEHAEADQEIIDFQSQSQSEASLIDALTSFDFNASFGSTKPGIIYSNRDTRFKCLTELIEYSSHPENISLNSQCISLLLTRAAFCLRRFIADQQLLYKCPIHKIQEDEIIVILQGLLNVLGPSIPPHAASDFTKLYRLLVKLVPYSSRIGGLSALLESIFCLY